MYQYYGDVMDWQKISATLVGAALIALTTQVLKIPVLEHRVDDLKRSLDENWRMDLKNHQSQP